MGGGFNGGYGGGGGEEDDRVHEWEAGLPNLDDLTPLNIGLIPPELLSAFNIKPEPSRTAGELTKAYEETLSTIRGQPAGLNFTPFDENQETIAGEGVDDPAEAEDDESDSKKQRRNVSPEDADSAAAVAVEETAEEEAADGKNLKRARLVWTPQLHKRFVDVVAHLGIKNAVPKTIMQLMNVEGLTRENVASHLQKYRLYLKRMQGVSFDEPSNSAALAVAPPPMAGNSPESGSGSGSGSGNGSGNGGMQVPMAYAPSQMVQMPVPMLGNYSGHMGMGMGMGMGNYNGFESRHHNNHYNLHHHHHHHHQFNGTMQSGNSKYGAVMSYHHHPPHVNPGDK